MFDRSVMLQLTQTYHTVGCASQLARTLKATVLTVYGLFQDYQPYKLNNQARPDQIRDPDIELGTPYMLRGTYKSVNKLHHSSMVSRG